MELFGFDDAYVRRLREGDEKTAAHFHGYFRDLLLLKLRRRLTSMDAIDEVRQEVFARTIEKLGELRDARKLGAFVASICNHVLLEYYRAEGRTEALEDQADLVDDVDPDSQYDSAKSTARVRFVLTTLPPRDAEILRAVFIDESDKADVCRRFNIDRAYLRVLLHRAKKEFRSRYLRRKSGRLSIFETFGGKPSLPV